MKLRVTTLLITIVFNTALHATDEGLSLVGLHLNTLRLNQQDNTLYIHSPALAQSVKVSVQSIANPKIYHETRQTNPAGMLELETKELRAAKLSAADLGMYARADNGMYLPLASSTSAAPPQLDTPVLILRASATLSRVSWRYAEAEQGQCQTMQNWMILDAPAGYRAGEAITIDLPDSLSQLCVEVVGKPRVGKNWLQGLWRIQLEEEE
jgi:hypothetical protein